MRRRRNKYGAKPVTRLVDGESFRFASRLESRVHDELASQLKAGETLAQQVTIRFASGVRYIVDFAIANHHGELVKFIEAKGKSLPTFALKLRLLKHEYPEIYERLSIHWGNCITPAGGKRPAKRRKGTP